MQQLKRVIGVPTATGVGVAAMLGAGVFAVWAPAAAHAGAWLPAALAAAFAVAVLNATSTTRLARAHPQSGGVFAFARSMGAPNLGFAAGALFLVGKVASAAAIARVAAEYLAPAAPGVVAVVLLLGLAAINASGVRSTALASAVTAVVVVAVLVTVDIVGALQIDEPHPLGSGPADAAGIVPAATIVFFAFAGYARVATLGGEVRDPRRTLPIAVALSLAVTGLLATATMLVLLWGLGPAALAESTAPLADLAGDAWRPLVAVAVVVACAGSALGVLAGLSRTAQSMASEGELPRPLAALHPRTSTPARADAVVAIAAGIAALTAPSAFLVAASAGAVLGYYAIAHVLAWRLGGAPGRVVAAVGALACTALAVWAPWLAIVIVVAVLLLGFTVRRLVSRPGRA